MMQTSKIHIFKINKVYLHSRHYFTSSNCIFMPLQGIIFIQLQGNDILVNCQGNIDSFKEHIFIHKNYNHLRHRRPKLIVCILYGSSGASDI